MSDPNRPKLVPGPLGRDLNRLKASTAQTTAELREFLHELRGKGPQEMLGAVAHSGLVQGVAMATAATLALLAVFTVGPYLVYGGPKRPAAPAQAAAAEPAPSDAAAKSEAAPADGKTAAPAGDKPVSPAAAAKALKEDEVKSGTPDVDSLLDKKRVD